MTSLPPDSEAGPAGTTCANGHENAPGAKFCATCGAAVAEAPEAGESVGSGMPAAAPAGTDVSPLTSSPAASAPPPPPPPPPPGAYGAVPPQYPMGAPQKTNGMAIASLITGILWIAPVALILGILANNQIKKSNGQEGGKGMAIAGIVLGAVGILGEILIVLFAVVFTAAVTTSLTGLAGYSDGYNWGTSHHSASISASTACHQAPVPSGDNSAAFYDGCIAAWQSLSGIGGTSGNTGNSGTATTTTTSAGNTGTGTSGNSG